LFHAQKERGEAPKGVGGKKGGDAGPSISFSFQQRRGKKERKRRMKMGEGKKKRKETVSRQLLSPFGGKKKAGRASERI